MGFVLHPPPAEGGGGGIRDRVKRGGERRGRGKGDEGRDLGFGERVWE